VRPTSFRSELPAAGQAIARPFGPSRAGVARRILPWVLVWLLPAGLVAFVVANQYGVAEFARQARTSTGTVIAREPNNHAIVRAIYEVDGQTYEIADSFIGPPNPDFESVRTGDRVTVYYDPARPSKGVLAAPDARTPDLGFALLAALALSTLLTVALVASRPLWRLLTG